MRVPELTDDDVGVWQVTTLTSQYVLDLDARRLTRTPVPGADAVLATDGDCTVVVPVSALPGDGAWLRLVALVRCHLGERMLLYRRHDSGRVTALTSTHVQCIQRIHGDTDPHGEHEPEGR